MKRFIVKKVTTVYRNSMIAGNPVERAFQKFGVYDREWQNDLNCGCYEHTCRSRLTNRKFRCIRDTKEDAQTIADKMNAIVESMPEVKSVAFNVGYFGTNVTLKSSSDEWGYKGVFKY